MPHPSRARVRAAPTMTDGIPRCVSANHLVTRQTATFTTMGSEDVVPVALVKSITYE